MKTHLSLTRFKRICSGFVLVVFSSVFLQAVYAADVGSYEEDLFGQLGYNNFNEPFYFYKENVTRNLIPGDTIILNYTDLRYETYPKAGIQIIKINLPPGIVSASFTASGGANLIDGKDGIIYRWGVFSASEAIPLNLTTDHLHGGGGVPPSGNLYKGNAIQASSLRTAYIMLYANYTYYYKRFSFTFTLGNNDTDVEAYRAWVPPVSTSTYIPPPTPTPTVPTTTPTDSFGCGTDCEPIIPVPTSPSAGSSDCNALITMLGLCTPASNTATREPALPQVDPASEDQTSVLEHLLEEALSNVGYADYVKSITVEGDRVSVMFENVEFKAIVDLTNIPSTIEGRVEPGSASFSTSPVAGLNFVNFINLTFKSLNSGAINTIPLIPLVDNQEIIRNYLLNFDDIVAVDFATPWMTVTLVDGQTITALFDNWETTTTPNLQKAQDQMHLDYPESNGHENDDVNGDGLSDIIIAFPDGRQRLVYMSNYE